MKKLLVYILAAMTLVSVLAVSTFAASVLFEGEDLLEAVIPVGETVPTCEVQNLSGLTSDILEWSGDKHLWWKPAAEGDSMEIKFTMPADGTYNIFVRLTKAGDYGMFQLTLDGKSIGDVVDCYVGGVECIEINLGSIELEAGDHTFGAVVAGKNESASNFLFGLDYLELVDGERVKKAFPSILKAENPDLGIKYVTAEGHLVYEGEAMSLVDGAACAPQNLEFLENDTRKWSNSTHMWWKCAFPSDYAVLEFPVEEAGEYNIQAALTRAVDYGIFDIYINDELVFDDVDCYINDVDIIYPETETAVKLEAGVNTIKIECVDSNSDATGYFFGLDYLKFAKVGAEKPVAEEPVAEEPVVEEPVIEKPVVEEPVSVPATAPQTADIFTILLVVMGITSSAAFISKKR